MEQLPDLADPRLVDGCMFCAKPSGRWTRDHCPSRVFLDEPYPPNLPIVDACEDCNNGFSSDEEYVACLIECVVAGSTDPASLRRPKIARILRDKPALKQRFEHSRREESGQVHFVPEAARVDNVVRKLARGHVAFELSTPLRCDPDCIAWWALPSMKGRDLERFEAAHVPALIGEVGSRSMQRMVLAASSSSAPLLVSHWIDVQEGRYRYLAFDDATESTVRIVLGEYLACEVTWSW